MDHDTEPTEETARRCLAAWTSRHTASTSAILARDGLIWNSTFDPDTAAFLVFVAGEGDGYRS